MNAENFGGQENNSEEKAAASRGADFRIKNEVVPTPNIKVNEFSNFANYADHYKLTEEERTPLLEALEASRKYEEWLAAHSSDTNEADANTASAQFIVEDGGKLTITKEGMESFALHAHPVPAEVLEPLINGVTQEDAAVIDKVAPNILNVIRNGRANELGTVLAATGDGGIADVSDREQRQPEGVSAGDSQNEDLGLIAQTLEKHPGAKKVLASLGVLVGLGGAAATIPDSEAQARENAVEQLLKLGAGAVLLNAANTVLQAGANRAAREIDPNGVPPQQQGVYQGERGVIIAPQPGGVYASRGYESRERLDLRSQIESQRASRNQMSIQQDHYANNLHRLQAELYAVNPRSDQGINIRMQIAGTQSAMVQNQIQIERMDNQIAETAARLQATP